MKKYLSLWQFAGFTIAVVLGTVLHFLFNWTGAFALAPISAVNESTWEHMKILFFPMLIISCIQYPFFKENFSGYLWIKLIGTTVGLVCMPVLFYTINGAFGKTPDWLNITLFFISAGCAYFIEYLLFLKDFTLPFAWIAVVLLLVSTGVFAIFTFYPPHIPLFQDPISKLYGIIV